MAFLLWEGAGCRRPRLGLLTGARRQRPVPVRLCERNYRFAGRANTVSAQPRGVTGIAATANRRMTDDGTARTLERSRPLTSLAGPHRQECRLPTTGSGQEPG